VDLFIQRAQAIRPDVQLTQGNAATIALICIRLDGLPLAIELAAARSKSFPPQTLLTRLEQGLTILSGGARDLPARQHTLRGALAWSYDLLSPEEQALFRRFAVFVDGCTWEVAEQVCTAAGELTGDVLEGLASLVDKSLLRQEEQGEGEPRFAMLQVLREFGLERLSSARELETTRQAHAGYYVRLSEEAEPHLRDSEQARWLDRLEQENLRTALSWLLEQSHLEVEREKGKEPAKRALRMSAALSWFWYLRGYVREERTFLERALSAREGVAALVRAKALLAAAGLAWIQDDFERVDALCGESLPQGHCPGSIG
jgi:predicted ATPase